MLYVFGIILSYLLGSIPMGLVLTHWLGRGDLRKVGSGNIGATNVLRVGGLRMAIVAWALDMAKAIVAVFIGCAISGDVFGAWCGFFAVLGHCFPVWLKFHGGKGVSSLFGIMLALSPLTFVFCGLEWLIVALTSGYSSLGAIIVFIVAPIFAFAISSGVGLAVLAISIVLCLRHSENIGRLVGGTESKIIWKWKK